MEAAGCTPAEVGKEPGAAPASTPFSRWSLPMSAAPCLGYTRDSCARWRDLRLLCLGGGEVLCSFLVLCLCKLQWRP